MPSINKKRYLKKIITRWDKVVFVGSIAGLIFLAIVTFYRHGYLKNLEEGVNKNEVYQKIEELERENKKLHLQVIELKKKIKEYEKTNTLTN